jgi:uncharacterized protein (DUF697 family)
MGDEKSEIRRQYEEAKQELTELGGWQSLKSGAWLWQLIQRSFKNYWERGTAEYFQEKYGTTDPEKLVPKLISVAARNASLLGGVVGAVVSTDELVGIFTGAEFGMGLPANIAIGLAAIGGEAILLIRFQLQLVANIGKAYGVPLDPDDPEDILTILAYAMGGGVAAEAGRFGMRVGGKLAGRMAKDVFKKEVLAFCKRLLAKVGVKLLQRNIVKYTVPVASVFIGGGWNYVSTRSVGWLAVRHFKQRLKDLPPAGGEAEQTGPPPETPFTPPPEPPPADCVRQEAGVEDRQPTRGPSPKPAWGQTVRPPGEANSRNPA